jgi:hypothetical protein
MFCFNMLGRFLRVPAAHSPGLRVLGLLHLAEFRGRLLSFALLHETDTVPDNTDETTSLHTFAASTTEAVLDVSKTFQPGDSRLCRHLDLGKLLTHCCEDIRQSQTFLLLECVDRSETRTNITSREKCLRDRCDVAGMWCCNAIVDRFLCNQVSFNVLVVFQRLAWDM